MSYSNPKDQLDCLQIREVSLTRKLAMLERALTKYYQQALTTTLSDVEQRCLGNVVRDLFTARVRLPQVQRDIKTLMESGDLEVYQLELYQLTRNVAK